MVAERTDVGAAAGPGMKPSDASAPASAPAGIGSNSISNTGTCCSGNQSKNDNSTGCSVHEMFELVLVVVFLFVPVFLVLGPAFFAWLAARVVFVQLCSRALVAHS